MITRHALPGTALAIGLLMPLNGGATAAAMPDADPVHESAVPMPAKHLRRAPQKAQKIERHDHGDSARKAMAHREYAGPEAREHGDD